VWIADEEFRAANAEAVETSSCIRLRGSEDCGFAHYTGDGPPNRLGNSRVCSTLTRLRLGDTSRRQAESDAANEVEGSSLSQSAAPDTLKSSCAHVIPELAEPKAGWHPIHSKSTCRLHEGVLICRHGGITCCSAAWTPQGNHPTFTLHHAAIIVCAYMLHSSENGSQLRSFSTLRACSVAAAVHSSKGVTRFTVMQRELETTLPVVCTGQPPRSILVSLRW